MIEGEWLSTTKRGGHRIYNTVAASYVYRLPTCVGRQADASSTSHPPGVWRANSICLAELFLAAGRLPRLQGLLGERDYLGDVALAGAGVRRSEVLPDDVTHQVAAQRGLHVIDVPAVSASCG